MGNSEESGGEVLGHETPAVVESVSSLKSMPFVPTGPCWVCGSMQHDRVWRDPFDLSWHPRFGPYAHADHAPSWVVRCRSCGFGQPESLPAIADFFEVLYAIDWTKEALDWEFDSGTKDLIFRNVLQGLEGRLPKGMPKSLLDIGTHVGRFVYLADKAGWEAEGVELNSVTAAYAAQRAGRPIHQRRAQDLIAEGRRFSALTFNDVLEHIPQPVPVLAKVRSLLHPGGLLAVKVPHGPVQRLKEKIRRMLLRRSEAGVGVRFVHVNHFTVSSLRLCLEAAGYRNVAIVVAAPDFVPASCPGRTHAQAWSAFLRRATYRTGCLIPGGVHTPLGLNLQAYAINPGDLGSGSQCGYRRQ